MQHSIAGQAALGPMANRGEVRFNRIGGPYALPVLSRKIIEDHQLLMVFVWTQRCLRALRLIGLDEQVKCLLRCCLGL